MSINVYVQANHVGTFTAYCDDTDTYLPKVGSYDQILADIAAHKSVCSECMCYGMFSQAVMDVNESVHLSNAHAGQVFASVGIAIDFCEGGSMAAAEFLSHFEKAEGLDVALKAGLVCVGTVAAEMGRKVVWN